MKLNGVERSEYNGMTVAEVVLVEGIPQRGVAVALNASVLRRREWSETVIGADDALEIVTAVAGG